MVECVTGGGGHPAFRHTEPGSPFPGMLRFNFSRSFHFAIEKIIPTYISLPYM